MKMVKGLTLVLENCEAIKLDEDAIGTFECLDIESNIARVALDCIAEVNVCKEFILEIKKTANQPYKSFSQESSGTVFDRLRKFDDVVSFELAYEDGETKSICMPWDESSQDVNDFQKSFIDEDSGSLFLIVGEDLTIFDVKKMLEEGSL